MTSHPEGVPLEYRDYERLVEQMLEQLNMGHSFNDLFDSVYDQLHGIVPYNRIAVALLEEPGDLLRLASCRSDGDVTLKVGYAARLTGSTLALLLATGQSRIINNLDDYHSGKPQSVSTELIRREGMKSSLTLPLLANGKPIGVIFFSSREAGTYTEQHAVLLRRLAGHIAISLEKAQLISELQRKNEDLASDRRTDFWKLYSRKLINRRNSCDSQNPAIDCWWNLGMSSIPASTFVQSSSTRPIGFIDCSSATA